MATDPWAEFSPQMAPQGSPVVGARGIPGAGPKPPSVTDVERIGMERERLRLAQEDAAREAAKFAAEEAKRAQEEAIVTGAKAKTAEALRNNLSTVQRLIKDADDNKGWFETGTSGRIARALPFSGAGYGLASELETLKANNAFTALIGLAEQGIKLTPISNEEVKLAAASIANLDPNVDHETFMRTLRGLEERYRQTLAGIEGGEKPQGKPDEAAQPARTGDDPTVLPSARMGRPDPGIQPTGVQDAGKGGLRPVPEFSGMAGDVQAMIQQGASADQVLAYVAKRHADAGYPAPNEERQQFIRDVVAARQARPDIPVGSLGQGWQNLEMVESPDVGGTALGSLADTNLGAGVIGAADVVTGGFLDEIAGLLGGNTDNARAVMSSSADERPVSTLAGNLAGGAMLPVGRAGATAKGLAKAGGGYGAVYGAGSADGNLDERATGALGGGLLGAVSGYGVGKYAQGADARSAAKAQKRANRASLLYDFTEQGVDALPANVGGPTSRVATSGAGQALLSSGSIRNAVSDQADQFGKAVTRNAQMAGTKLPPDEAGMLARKAGERFSKKTSQRGSLLYDRAEAAAGDVKIVPQQAIAEIDAKIARLSQSPDAGAASVVKELQGFKQRLADGVSIVGLRDARTRLSQGVYDGKLRSNADQKIYRDILGKVSDDIEAGLRAEGKDRVAGMFKTADKYWTQRVEYIDEVLEPIIGKGRAGEGILQSIESMATGKTGGVQRLSGLMQSLSDAERGQIQATVIDRMGRATKGNQDDAGNVFSANTFLTNWNGLSAKGKDAMFGDGELRKSLDQLARVASNIKDVSRYTNTSNTAGALGWQAAISGATGVISYPAAILLGGAQYITGKMLASPKFAAWLARAPKNATPAQARAYSERLKNIATAEPVIASDIGRFSQFLNAANDTSPSVAVAGPQGEQENN